MQVCPPGLHIMLGIFTKMFHLLKALCCQLDLELASHTITTDFNFSKYSQALQRLPLLQGDLKTDSREVLQQVAIYVALLHGEENPLAVDLLKQFAAKKKSVKALVSHYTACTIVFKLVQYRKHMAKRTATVKEGTSEKEGPFVKTLDNALQSFGVRQQYLGGIYWQPCTQGIEGKVYMCYACVRE